MRKSLIITSVTMVAGISLLAIGLVRKKSLSHESLSIEMQDLFYDEWIDIITFEDYENIEEYLHRKPILCYNNEKRNDEMRNYYVKLFRFIQDKRK